jgi:hypothetical protein
MTVSVISLSCGTLNGALPGRAALSDAGGVIVTRREASGFESRLHEDASMTTIATVRTGGLARMIEILGGVRAMRELPHCSTGARMPGSSVPVTMDRLAFGLTRFQRAHHDIYVSGNRTLSQVEQGR